jgi:dephospho-CoA kinase
MIVAGLTGGIATGKSTVAAVFEAAGARLIDADRIARDVVRKGTSAYRDIVAHFGMDVVCGDGEIDRRQLADIVFNDPAAQRALEDIVHPQVKREVDRRVDLIRRQAPEALVLLDIPLLFEAGMQEGLDAVIVVYAPERLQLERLMARDGLTESEALARIRAQMPIESKKALATRVIDNSGSREQTREQALEVYRQLAASQTQAPGMGPGA